MAATRDKTIISDWRAPPNEFPAKTSQLDIWLLNLDDIPCQSDCLDATEITRLNKFKFDLGRQRYCTAHSAMRAILGRYLDCRAGDVPILIDPGGKPRINHKTPPLHFNLSHTENTALLAINTGHEVGVDVELFRDMPNIDRIAKRTFRDNEITQLEQSGWDKNLFFEFWTHMEARQKCLGRGVFGDAASDNEVETHSLALKKNQFGAVAWAAGNAPTLINLYQD